MNVNPTDEQLVAYLDNQLDSEQRQRIDAAVAEDPMLGLRLQWLNRSSLPFKSAYDELASQAPVDRMQAMLDTLPAAPARPESPLVPRGGSRAGGERRARGSFVPRLASQSGKR